MLKRGPFLAQLLQAMGSLLIAVVIWQALVVALKMPAYVLPDPLAVLKSLWFALVAAPAKSGFFNQQALYKPTLETLYVVGAGFLLGAAVGVLTAILLFWFSSLDRLFLPLLAAFQSLPKVALAPLFVIWFGYGAGSRIALTTVLVFFPVLVNSRAALLGVDPNLVMMAQAFNASRLRLLHLIQLPSALPYIMTGLEIGIVYALLGAIVGEFTAGQQGLGARMLELQYANAIPTMFGILVVLGVIGALLHQLIGAIRKRFIVW